MHSLSHVVTLGDSTCVTCGGGKNNSAAKVHLHAFLKFFYSEAVPNAFSDRAWGATWETLKAQGKSDKEIDYLLYTEKYDHPMDQTKRSGDSWDWKGHSLSELSMI